MADENVTTVAENTTTETTETESKAPTVEQLMSDLAKMKSEKQKIKDSLDKTLREKGEITKALRAKQTAEEQLAEEKAEAQRLAAEELENMRSELNHYKATSAYKDIQEAETVEKLIEAVSLADHNAIAEIIANECASAVRKAEAEWLNSRPQVASGNNSTTISREHIMAIKDPVERQRLIANNMNLFN